MKSIKTLIPDIYSLLKSNKEWFNDELARTLSDDLSRRLRASLGPREARGSLRLSQMGPRCPCALWHSVLHPERAEPLPPWAEIKYAFGHVIEALAITLTKAAGHTVTGEQDELDLDGIIGHRDCVIDGCIVDIKSAASISFNKFRSGEIAKSDGFGYLDQLDGYVLASANDPLVEVKDKGYLLVIDKQLGHMCLYEHEVTDERARAIKDRIRDYKRITSYAEAPACSCRTIPQGASGNQQLDTVASYSPYKYCCRPDLRCFKYSGGPVYLTKVVRKPDVPEIDRYGKVIY